MRFEMQWTLDQAKVKERFLPRYKEAQAYIDRTVLEDCAPYVPFDTGALAESGAAAEGGQVVYTAPYARRLYYGDGYQFNTSAHPLACAHWFERAKAARKEEWTAGVRRILTGAHR